MSCLAFNGFDQVVENIPGLNHLLLAAAAIFVFNIVGVEVAIADNDRVWDTDQFHIGKHHARTLFTVVHQHVDTVRTMFDERFIRMWRMYLAGSVAAFEASYYQLFQVVFNRASCNDLAMTREHLYETMNDQIPMTNDRS